MQNLVDLTHTLHSNISIYPGSKPPIVRQLATVEQQGYAEKEITIYSHHGTHVDAPAHMIKGGKTLNELNLNHFIGLAMKVDLTNHAGKIIETAFFEPYSLLLNEIDFLLLHTGWSSKWGNSAYQQGYPTLSAAATHFICEYQLKGIGMDCLSPDPVDSPDYINHQITLGQDVILIENLNQLEKLPDKPFDFQCFPMNIEQADGAPVRAIAVL